MKATSWGQSREKTFWAYVSARGERPIISSVESRSVVSFFQNPRHNDCVTAAYGGLYLLMTQSRRASYVQSPHILIELLPRSAHLIYLQSIGCSGFSCSFQVGWERGLFKAPLSIWDFINQTSLSISQYHWAELPFHDSSYTVQGHCQTAFLQRRIYKLLLVFVQSCFFSTSSPSSFLSFPHWLMNFLRIWH